MRITGKFSPYFHSLQILLIVYRHDVYDVTCGSILGMSVTYFSYRRYYPRLHAARCDEPYPSREATFNEGFGKLKTDEEANLRGVRDFVMTDSEDES